MAGPFPAALGVTLAIGATEPVTIALDEQPPVGPWSARITLRSGLLEHTEEMIITFPDAGATPNTALPQPAAPAIPVWQSSRRGRRAAAIGVVASTSAWTSYR